MLSGAAQADTIVESGSGKIRVFIISPEGPKEKYEQEQKH